jgi:ribosomal-protein-alanine N-acetyltransferase
MVDPYRVRTARPADLEALAALEQQIFPDPWALESFRQFLEGVILVADDADEVVGYTVARWVLEQGEILNLAVHPDHRRHRVASRLLHAVLDALWEEGVRMAFLEVRQSNGGARAFYERHGFCEVGKRRNYYRYPREDALILARSLDDAPPFE